MLLGTATLLLGAEFPAPIVDNKSPAGVGKQTAVLAGGCFWCVEAVFQQIEGVEKVVSGYSGPLIAALIPAWTASRVDPMGALRYE